MARLIWSPRAADDLEKICEFISRDSEEYARLMAQRVVSIVKSIPAMPYMGRTVPEYNDERIRERIFQKVRIVYRIESEDRIEIVRIAHSAQLLE